MTHCTKSLKRRIVEGIGKGRGNRKREREALELYRTNKTKKGKRNYTGDALTLLFFLMNALVTALENSRGLKPSNKLPPKVLILNLPRTEQLQRRCSTVSNSSSSQHIAQSSDWNLFQIPVSDLIP